MDEIRKSGTDRMLLQYRPNKKGYIVHMKHTVWGNYGWTKTCIHINWETASYSRLQHSEDEAALPAWEVPSDSILEDVSRAFMTIPTTNITQLTGLWYSCCNPGDVCYMIKKKSSTYPHPWKLRLEAKINLERLVRKMQSLRIRLGYYEKKYLTIWSPKQRLNKASQHWPPS